MQGHGVVVWVGVTKTRGEGGGGRLMILACEGGGGGEMKKKHGKIRDGFGFTKGRYFDMKAIFSHLFSAMEEYFQILKKKAVPTYVL